MVEKPPQHAAYLSSGDIKTQFDIQINAFLTTLQLCISKWPVRLIWTEMYVVSKVMGDYPYPSNNSKGGQWRVWSCWVVRSVGRLIKALVYMPVTSGMCESATCYTIVTVIHWLHIRDRLPFVTCLDSPKYITVLWQSTTCYTLVRVKNRSHSYDSP